MDTEPTPDKTDPVPRSRSAPIIGRAPLPIVEVQGSAHRVSHVNAAFCLLIGKSKEDLIGKSFADIVQGGDQCVPMLDSVYQTGQAATHAQDNGSDPDAASWLYVMWPALDENEQPVGVIIQLAKSVKLRQDTVAVNEALLMAGLRQHELTEEAVKLNEQLQAEIIERRQTEQKLRASELAVKRALDYAEATLRTTPVPFLVLRADLRVNTASEAFYTDFKVRPAETEGRLIYEIGNGQWNIPKLRELLEEIIPKNNVFDGFEVMHEFATIGTRTMLLNARRMDNAEGVPERILLAIEDITERMRAEASLRQNREVFLEVIEQAPMAVCVLDGQMRMLHVNSVAQPTFTGVEPLIGRDNSEIIRHLWPPETADGVLEIFRHTLATGEPYMAPTLTERRQDTGVEESYDWQLRRIVLPDGERGIACYFNDVSVRQRAEVALRTSEENYRLLVEGATGFAIIRLDFSGRVTMWNMGAARILGYEEAEILGEHFSRFFTPEQIADGMPEREMAEASAKEKCDDDNELVRKDGSRFWANGATTALRDEAGKLTGFAKIVRDVSNQRRAHDDLRESEERFRVAALAVSNIIWTNNAQGMMEGEQPGWAQFTGQTREEYQGDGWARAVHPDDARSTLQAWNVAVAEKRLFEFEHRVRRHDGAWRACSVRAVPVIGGDGGIREWVGVHNDITERRQAEERLRTSEERFRGMVQASHDCIKELDLDGHMLSMNPTGQCLLEIDNMADCLRATWVDLWKDQSHPAAIRALAAARAGGVGEFEGFCPTFKGTPKWWSVVVTPILSTMGAPVRLMVISRDITERQRVETALRASEEQFRIMADNISQLAWISGDLGSVAWYNKRWLEYTGLTFDEMRDWGWKTVHDPEHFDRVVRGMRLANEKGEIWEDTFPLRSKEGPYRWFLTRAIPIRDENGTVIRWFGTNTDVTSQRENAEVLARAMAEVERVSCAKDDFLASLSHELRTPLTPVLMMATALENDEALTPKLREQLSMMRRNIELEARLIDDLLDLTRISRGKLVIDRQPVDVHLLLDHTAEIVLSDRLGRAVRIVFRHGAARHYALADCTRLQQVFWNLIKNAVKFTPPAGKITVTTRNDEAGRILISVADTGLGISEEALPHIFKAFEQGDVSGQHRYGGLGLGLAISKAIMESHGGTILAESPGPGHGATFTLALDSADAPAAASPTHATPDIPSRALRLLVVEDHETTRNVLEHLLTSRGHHVTTAGSIQEALEAFAADHFDGIISDLGLPDGSGLDLMRQIQRQRPVPAIALSGYGMEDDLRRTKEAGFFAHLVKPVNLDQLRQLIDQITPSLP